MLRAATGDAHERLDALFAGFAIASRDGYARFLAAHAMALPALERALDARGFAGELSDWPRRRRSDALAADLAALGEPQPPALAAPALGDRAACWGAAYVLEGSRLGGAMLARMIPPGAPDAYLAGPRPPGAWRAFLTALETALASADALASAVAAANASFALFEAAGARMAGAPAA